MPKSDLSTNRYMQLALEQAKLAYAQGEVPIGAVIVHHASGTVYAAHNQVERGKDVLAHAELMAIRACQQATGAKYFEGYSLYCTLEPCPMCAQAISYARFDALYFGAEDEKYGGSINGPKVLLSSTAHHKPDIYDNIMADESRQLLQRFFGERR